MNQEINKKLSYEVERLLNYGLEKNLIFEDDLFVVRNYLLSHFKLTEPFDQKVEKEGLRLASDILQNMLDLSYEKGLLPDNTLTVRDLESAKIMGLLTPRQSEIVKTFQDLYKESPEQATKYFYALSQNTDYIQVARTDKNIYWQADADFGNLEITINLSKPEKDPKEIAAAKNAPQSGYPKCLLCAENAGYEGRLNHPARQNHRIIPIELDGHRWYFQYSPYLYYNEHCIILNEDHMPMKISEQTFRRLLDFIEKFPHYFIGSNADLPIVGGSILSHDHFQGGRHQFPMEMAKKIATFTHEKFGEVTFSIIQWPLSAIRTESSDKEALVLAGTYVLDLWRSYTDDIAGIYAFTEENGEQVPHNTITPIARKNASGNFEMDLVLRNNLTTEEFPLGVFHPHQDVHHIKKENIGLIEVMGLAILPARLKEECEEIEKILTGEEMYTKGEQPALLKHEEWIEFLIEKYGTNLSTEDANQFVKHEIGQKFARVLEDAGVYKLNETGKEQFISFMKAAGFEMQ